MNVRTIPFPSVTICSQTKTKAQFVFFENVYRELFEKSKVHGEAAVESKYFESLLHVCDPQLLRGVKLNNSMLNADQELVAILRQISYSTDDSMMFCKWRSAIKGCKDLFTTILTDQGFCQTFNILDFEKVAKDRIKDDFAYSQKKNSSWGLQDGYKTNNLSAYPWPIISQQHDALRILLKTTDTDTDYICHGSNQGFKIFFHTPNEFPNTYGKHVFVPLEQEMIVKMRATMTKTSKDLMKYTPKIRECYQDHEKPLRFFRTYTKNNCEIECLTEFVYKSCGCVKFSMPRENRSKICSIHKIECISTAERNFMSQTQEDETDGSNCNCLPSCTEIKYESQTSMVAFHYEKLFDSYSFDMRKYRG